MLTALSKDRTSRVVLPDFTSADELEEVRERASSGDLVCPGCCQLIWLRAGEIRIPHFAHRVLSDCPHSGTSELVVAARILIYQFFRDRIQDGQIQGAVEVEPLFEKLPAKTHLDVLFKPPDRAGVAISILNSNLRPDARVMLRRIIESNNFLFRPVFLESRLRQNDARTFRLDMAQREYKQDSPFGVTHDYSPAAPTLRFVAPQAEQWLSLRSLQLVESPQNFSATQKFATMDRLQWHPAEADWIHPGEEHELQQRRERLARNPPPFSSTWSKKNTTQEASPTWQRHLVCVGCHQRTTAWTNAVPSKDICVCFKCFNNGARLPTG